METIRIEKRIVIRTDANRIFAFFCDPSLLSTLLPGFTVSRVPALPLQEGAEFDYCFPLAGTTLNGTWTVSKLKAPWHYEAHTKGLSESRWVMELEAAQEGTLCKLSIEYGIPDGLITHVITGTVTAAIDGYAAGLLENLKKALEPNQGNN